MKNISEIIIEKEVRRPKRNYDGSRYYENLVFKVKYNPTIKAFHYRLFSKVVDLVFYGMIVLLFYSIIGRTFYDNYEIYSASLLVLLLINPILESKFGKSLGKLIFKIQVINNCCEFPKLGTSYKRNLLSLSNIFAILRPIPTAIGFIKNNKHNEICNTYTIFDTTKPEIVALMKT